MYYTIVNDNILTAQTEDSLSIFYENVKKAPEDFEYGKYIVKDGELVLNPDFEKEQEEAERQRISLLSLTAADVERAIYKAKGMDFDDLIEFVKSNSPEGLDIKALKIELKANNFYRGNSYVEQIGTLLGYSSDDLDYLFKNKKLPEKTLDDVIEATEEAKLYGDELTDFLNLTQNDIDKINNSLPAEALEAEAD